MLKRFTLGLTCALALLAAPAAQAVRTASPACPARAFSPVFATWGDSALYTLAPGGDFEAGAAGWTLSGGAVLVSGTSPYGVGRSSLSLPAGAVALSPPICVEKNYPSWRFAAASGGGRLGVEVLYPKKAKSSGTVTPTAGWSLSPVLRFSTGQFNGGAEIRVRFTASGKPVRLDDVYIDPRFWR